MSDTDDASAHAETTTDAAPVFGAALDTAPGAGSPARSLITVASTLIRPDERVPLFPTDPQVPRRRRPSDAARLAATGAVFVLLGWLASTEPDLDVRIARLFASLPDWMRSLAWVAYSGAGLFALALVVASVKAGDSRRDLVRDLLCSLALATVLGVFAARAATGAWPDMIPEFSAVPGRPPYPTLRPTLVLIVTLVLGVYVNAQMQRAMRWMTAFATVPPVLLGLTTGTAMVGAIALGVLAVAVIRLAFGSPEGLPSIDRLRGLLARVGLAVDDLAYAPTQPGTVGLASATAEDGRSLEIKVFSVDASSRQRAERIWRALWYRRAGPSPRAGRVEQAQHEALAILTARDAGVNVPPLVAVGQDTNGDVLLVTIAPHGIALADLDEITDDDLLTCWRELGRLRRQARLAHGSIGPATVMVDGGRAQLTDLADASLLPTAQQLASDVVAMLATHAVLVGADRATRLALEGNDRELLLVALPYCQESVVEPALRRRLRDAGVELRDLGSTLAEELGVERPDPAAVRRVSWGDVALSLAAIIAANALIGQIADVGLDTLLDELRDATLGWLVVAFVINIASSAAAYIGLRAVVGRPLPWSPTALLQLAKRFVGLVVPSMVGRVGLDIRFLQRQGVPTAVASTQGPVISFIGFLSEVSLLAISAWALGQSIDLDELNDVDAGGLVLIALLVVVLGVAAVFAVPKLRTRVVPFVRDALGTIRSVLTSPSVLARVYASESIDRLMGALALGATVAAFGADLSFGALVFVSVGTGLLAGLAPVPGGIGVAEATMSGLLTACGLPTEQAVSIAIVHRVATAYLPPIIGFVAFNWLRREKYL